ncbi:MAG: TonB family protein, partial [Candidatus Competibacter sp.]
MSEITHDTEVAGRLLLALLLASGLHAALLFGVPAEWWAIRYPKPPRFEVVLLPPAPVPTEPARGIPVPEPATPAAAPTPPIAQPSEPAALAETPAPVSKPVPKPVEPARSPTPVTRIKPAAPPKPRSPPKPKPIQPPKPARPTATKLPSQSIQPRQPPVAKPATPEPTQTAHVSKRAPAPGGTRARGPLDSTALLGQIASLDTEIQQRANAGIRSQRVSLADTRSAAGFYAADWARKVTRVGEMNFPDAARRLNLSTGPLLDVAIRADGSLREVRILRSSGNSELDRAARRIVELAAPYPP